MTERIIWNGEKKKYQPRIKNSRIHELYRIKEVTKRPITVLLDEALEIYITNFLVMMAELKDEAIEVKIDEMSKPMDNDDFEDLTIYMDQYGEANSFD